MKHKVLIKSDEQDVFTDLLFNALLGFAFMFAIAFMLINSSEDSGKIEAKAEILISVSWPDNHPDDVDAIVEDPQGGLVWYHNRDSGLMHLDRDDRGVFADKMNVNGKTISNPINQETVTVRKLQAGEYVVNLLHYKANYEETLNVDVKVEKLNPQVDVFGLDLSLGALKVASMNKEKLELNNLHLLNSDWLKALKENTFDSAGSTSN